MNKIAFLLFFFFFFNFNVFADVKDDIAKINDLKETGLLTDQDYKNLLEKSIIKTEEYKKIYASESYDTKDINIVKTYGYHLWQYTSKPNSNNSTVYLGSRTNYRKLIKPLHLTSLYGKWVLLLYLVYIIIGPLIN